MIKKLPIRWDKQAKKKLDDIYFYIAKDSVPAARKVKKELIRLAHSLNDFPEKFPKEPLLYDEAENYRSVTKWNYKIIYEVTEDYLIIIDIFHTAQHPLKVKSNLKK